MKHLFFGLTRRYDGGSQPAISLNRGGVVLEVHKNQAGSSLYYRVGRLSQATIQWEQSRFYSSGLKPRVALNARNIAFEVHEAPVKATLWFTLWEVQRDQVRQLDKKQYDNGYTPAVAMNDHGIVVEVHAASKGSNANLWYQVWRVEGSSVRRLDKRRYSRGSHPVIAINNSGTVIEMHGRTYHVCRFDGTRVVFGPGIAFGVNAVSPTVALTDDGLVIVNYRVNTRLWHRTGKVAGDRVVWDDPVAYDIGGNPAVAAAGEMSVSVNEYLYGLWFSTSLITDRAAWMQNHLAMLGNTRLGDLVLPASHDAAMYTRSFASPWTKTQDLTIYGQLRWGLRYFDLRPKWTGRKFVIHHGGVHGPDLSEVLADIRKFALENHRELAILKLSHFDNIDNATYANLARLIEESIGQWLYKSTLPDGKRLADVTLSEYVAGGPAFLVVVDGNYAVEVARKGFWVYRNWNAAPARDDLRVFDVYSNTQSYDAMRNHQFHQFAQYKGLMEQAPQEPCDLFLLSWTLTPRPPIFTPVWELAKVANPHLGQEVRFGQDRNPIPNGHGQITNLLYTDYVEFARVTDVAVFHNRARAAQAAAEARPAKRRAIASTSTSESARLPVRAKASRTKTTAKASAKVKGAPKSRTRQAKP